MLLDGNIRRRNGSGRYEFVTYVCVALHMKIWTEFTPPPLPLKSYTRTSIFTWPHCNGDISHMQIQNKYYKPHATRHDAMIDIVIYAKSTCLMATYALWWNNPVEMEYKYSDEARSARVVSFHRNADCIFCWWEDEHFEFTSVSESKTDFYLHRRFGHLIYEFKFNELNAVECRVSHHVFCARMNTSNRSIHPHHFAIGSWLLVVLILFSIADQFRIRFMALVHTLTFRFSRQCLRWMNAGKSNKDGIPSRHFAQKCNRFRI